MTLERTRIRAEGVFQRLLGLTVTAVSLCGLPLHGQSQAHVIEILADHDSRYKIAGQKEPAVTLKVGEQVILRITANKAKNRNRDGSVHGLTLLHSKDRKPVDGWDLLLKPGTQEFALVAPSEAGDYLAICTVICSRYHEGMIMKIRVEP
jgi:hypothetical protein